MKRKDIQSLHSKKSGELTKELEAKQKEIKKLRLEMYMGKVKNVHIVRTLSDECARIATVLNEIREKEKPKS